MMPESAALAGTRGLPPFGLAGSGGNNPSTSPHSSSLTIPCGTFRPPGKRVWAYGLGRATKGWSALLERGAWSLLTTGEKLGEVAQHRFSGIFLGEVGAVGNRLEPRARDRRVELLASLQRQPAVLLAPQDEDGALDPSVERLNLVGVALVVLRYLAVEGGLTLPPSQGSR